MDLLFLQPVQANPLVSLIPTETSQVQQIQEPQEYTILAGDNLTKIAELRGSSWQRIWQKNLNITHPDELHVGVKILIPLPDEVLAERPLPVPEPAPQIVAKTTTKVLDKPQNVAGNGYVRGYCTWYVKNRRPDLPNNLGNAITWVSRASAMGLPTGNTPVVGAVGQQGNHVVYVESVNGGEMTISEMNFKGWNIKSTRTVSSAGWRFIY